MDQKSDPAELERQLEQARRLAATTTDRTTVQRLKEFTDELRSRLLRAMGMRSNSGDAEDAIRARARELWEQNGRPDGRDEEFWLAAEREIREAGELDKPDNGG